MAVGAYAAYKLRCAFPGLNLLVALRARRRHRGAGRRPVRHSQPAHQGLLSRGGDARRAVLLDWVFSRIAVVLPTTRRRARSARRRSTLFGYHVRHAGRANTCSCSTFVGVFALVAQESGARPHRARLDGDPRHGRRRRDHRHPPADDEALGVRGQLVLHRRRRRAVGVHLPGLVGAARLRHRPLVPAAVHGHHRRAGLASSASSSARRSSCCCRSCSTSCPRMARAACVDRADLALRDHDIRRPDRLLPDRRAARPGAAVGDRARRSCGCGRSRTERCGGRQSIHWFSPNEQAALCARTDRHRPADAPRRQK